MSHHFQAATVYFLAARSAQLWRLMKVCLHAVLYTAAMLALIFGPSSSHNLMMIVLMIVIISWITTLASHPGPTDAKEE